MSIFENEGMELPYEPLAVRPTLLMSPGDFASHMALRHNQRAELGGMTNVSEGGATRDRKVWEAYHERLHNIEEYDHEH